MYSRTGYCGAQRPSWSQCRPLAGAANEALPLLNMFSIRRAMSKAKGNERGAVKTTTTMDGKRVEEEVTDHFDECGQDVSERTKQKKTNEEKRMERTRPFGELRRLANYRTVVRTNIYLRTPKPYEQYVEEARGGPLYRRNMQTDNRKGSNASLPTNAVNCHPPSPSYMRYTRSHLV